MKKSFGHPESHLGEASQSDRARRLAVSEGLGDERTGQSETGFREKGQASLGIKFEECENDFRKERVRAKSRLALVDRIDP